jgi:hypothetical protein
MNAHYTANRLILDSWSEKKRKDDHRMDVISDQYYLVGYVEEINECNLAVLFHPNSQRNIISLSETS